MEEILVNFSAGLAKKYGFVGDFKVTVPWEVFRRIYLDLESKVPFRSWPERLEDWGAWKDQVIFFQGPAGRMEINSDR